MQERRRNCHGLGIKRTWPCVVVNWSGVVQGTCVVISQDTERWKRNQESIHKENDTVEEVRQKMFLGKQKRQVLGDAKFAKSLAKVSSL